MTNEQEQTPADRARMLLQLRWFWERIIDLRERADEAEASEVSDWLSCIEDEVRVELEVGQIDLRDALSREGGGS